MGLGLPIVKALVSCTNTSHSVALLWTSEQTIAETSTWQHSWGTDIHVPCGIQTHSPNKRVAIGPCLRPCAQWVRPLWHSVDTKYSLELSFTMSVCDSLKCLFISYVQKSEFGIWKMNYRWEFIKYESAGCTQVEFLKAEGRLYITISLCLNSI